jgi:hypothetical protein
MNAASANKLHSDDLVFDHINILAEHTARINAVETKTTELSDKLESTNKTVSNLNIEMIVIKTKLFIYTGIAVLASNMAFQIILKFFF